MKCSWYCGFLKPWFFFFFLLISGGDLLSWQYLRLYEGIEIIVEGFQGEQKG